MRRILTRTPDVRDRRAPWRRAGALAAIGAVGAWLLLGAACRDESSRLRENEVRPRIEGRDAGSHAIWLRRRWLHEPRTDADIATLVARLHAHDIDTIYPFVGPMRPGGRFGWRDGEALREYDPATARAFFQRIKAVQDGGGMRVLPWAGGVLNRDVRLDDPAWRRAFVAQAKALVDLGADGIQLNIEPMPAWQDGYLDLIHELRASLGPDAIIGVAAYPPPTPLHPFPDVHWSLDFLAEVCRVTDDVAVMAYDTALTTPAAYAALMTEWTDALGGRMADCTWRMGVPTYEDDKPWHRPDAETLAAAIAGIDAATAEPHGMAIYASWTTDAAEWALFDLRVRERTPTNVEAVDPP